MAWITPALPHCDTLDGPVISAARKALDTGDADLALVWAQKDDEADMQSAFRRTRNARKVGGEAKDLADTYLFETPVRLHRAGEGAPFTGQKPAGQIEAPVAAADRAISPASCSRLPSW